MSQLQDGLAHLYLFDQGPKWNLHATGVKFLYPWLLLFSRSTLHERQMTVKLWGDQRICSYGDMNLFAVLDWSSSNQNDTTGSNTTRTSHMLQRTQIEHYAPLSGYLHANSVMYPPCLSMPSHFDRTHAKMTTNLSDTFNHTELPIVVPWTMQLEHKIVLIIHPFIDTMRHNIPQLQKIWFNVPSDKIKGTPYSCFPNVTEFKFLRTPLPKARDNNSISWLDALDLLRRTVSHLCGWGIATFPWHPRDSLVGPKSQPLLQDVGTDLQRCLDMAIMVRRRKFNFGGDNQLERISTYCSAAATANNTPGVIIIPATSCLPNNKVMSMPSFLGGEPLFVKDDAEIVHDIDVNLLGTRHELPVNGIRNDAALSYSLSCRIATAHRSEQNISLTINDTSVYNILMMSQSILISM